jgi:hypothetical protein
MKTLVLLGILGAATGTLGAQEFSHMAYSLGAGFSTPIGATGQNLDTGWNLRASGGWNFTSRVGVMLDAGLDFMGVNSTVLSNMGYGSGKLSVFSLTLDPIVHLTPNGPVDFYVTGGGGYFHQNLALNDQTPIGGTVGNSFFSYLPTSPLVNSAASNKPGVDAAVGLEFGHKWGGKFFAEARYIHIYTGNYATSYLPVTFGFRH